MAGLDTGGLPPPGQTTAQPPALRTAHRQVAPAGYINPQHMLANITPQQMSIAAIEQQITTRPCVVWMLLCWCVVLHICSYPQHIHHCALVRLASSASDTLMLMTHLHQTTMCFWDHHAASCEHTLPNPFCIDHQLLPHLQKHPAHSLLHTAQTDSNQAARPS